MSSKSLTEVGHATHIDMEDQKASHIAIHNETYDIDEAALGTNLPEKYYWSPAFIGTVAVRRSIGDTSS